MTPDEAVTADEIYGAGAAPHGVGSLLLHVAQITFLLSVAAITVAIAGIRGGKTHVGALKTLFYAITHPCDVDEMHLVCSPTYQMSKVPVEKIFKLLYDKSVFPFCPLVRYHKSERMFILTAMGGTGVTRIKIVSLHDPDKIRGIKALSAWLDEGAYITSEAWMIIQGRVADSNGPIWITTTPAGYNFIHELYAKAMQEKRSGVPLAERVIRFVHWRSTDNTFISMDGFHRLADNFDERTHAQEVDAKFVKVAGQVYHAFSRSRNIRDVKLDRSKVLIIGQDFNVTKMASSILQPFKTQDFKPGLAVVDERLAPDTDTFKLASWIDRYISENGILKKNVHIYPDASGKARSTTGRSDHQILRDAGFRVIARLANPLVKDRTNTVNGLLAPRSSKFPRLVVAPDCQHHIATFTKQTYAEGSDPPVPDKAQGLDHIGDAVGYPCWQLFPLRRTANLGNQRAA